MNRRTPRSSALCGDYAKQILANVKVDAGIVYVTDGKAASSILPLA
jgi:hypothetical protein